MAFPQHRAGSARRLREGDRLLIYATAKCFPGDVQGRVVAEGAVASDVEAFDRPIFVAGREFTQGCWIELGGLAPFGGGIVLADCVDELDVFPSSRTWSAYLRRPVLGLPASDANLLRRRLKAHLIDPEEAVEGYAPPSKGQGGRSSRRFVERSRH